MFQPLHRSASRPHVTPAATPPLPANTRSDTNKRTEHTLKKLKLSKPQRIDIKVQMKPRTWSEEQTVQHGGLCKLFYNFNSLKLHVWSAAIHANTLCWFFNKYIIYIIYISTSAEKGHVCTKQVLKRHKEQAAGETYGADSRAKRSPGSSLVTLSRRLCQIISFWLVPSPEPGLKPRRNEDQKLRTGARRSSLPAWSGLQVTSGMRGQSWRSGNLHYSFLHAGRKKKGKTFLLILKKEI